MTTANIEALEASAKAELSALLAKESISLKDKLAITPQKPAELSPLERRTTMQETSLGFTESQARLEANRCMKCKKPFCTASCPIGMPVPAYLELVAAGNFEDAIQLIRDTSLFPSICSRVCPHEKQCQQNCAIGKSLKDPSKGLSLGNLERFCADYEREKMGGKKILPIDAPTGKKVAVIGGGPAGLAAAIDLRTFGHDVVIFESAKELGGVLRYGIPEFRLPKEILDYELSILPKMGISCKFGITVGKDITIPELFEKENFDAVFIGNGAGLALKTGVPGEELKGVFTAEEYLRKGNLSQPIESGKNVVVVGGGNVAMDASRMAFRLGAEKVRIVYRRTKNEMPACKAELHEALEEGVEILELKNPAEILSDTNGRVEKIRLDLFELGEPDEQGRARPVKIEGEEEFIDADTVVLAIGSKVSSEIKDSTPGLETNRNGTFIVQNSETGETSCENVFVGGDALHGPQTVVLAMKTGRIAAKAIHEKLS